MHPYFDNDLRRGTQRGGSDLGQWMLALVAVLFLWGTLIVMGQQLHP